MAKPTRSRLLRDNAFSEVSRYEPERVTVTRRRHGEKAAKGMQTAIALDAARQKGAKVQKREGFARGARVRKR